MLLTLAVSLYTSRIVLSTLGIDDFGIYNIVGGVVMMFGFLNSAMTVSTQRFLMFELGKGDYKELKHIFSLSTTLHLLISVLVLLLAETVGLWLLNSKLTIPVERMHAANWVYQFSVFSLILTILSVPYNAIIIAREKMNVFAYIGVVEVSLKLLVVFLLALSHSDKLIVYSVLLFTVSLFIRLIYGIYCKKHYEESHYKFYWNKKKFIEMSSFAGWNLFGVFAGIGGNQGVNIVLNIFFGPTINAARGIAYQVMAAVNLFVSNFQIAVNPPITKAYASGDKGNLYTIVYAASKYSFFLMFFLVLPLLFETRVVLETWLKLVPQHTVTFTRLVLIDIVICCVSGPLQILVQATGKVRIYQLVVSTLLFLNLPISYIVLKLGYEPESVFLISIFLSFLSLICRLCVLRRLIEFPVCSFLSQSILPILKIVIFPVSITFFVYESLTLGWTRFFILCTISTLSIFWSIWLLGISKEEKIYIMKYYNNKIVKK